MTKIPTRNKVMYPKYITEKSTDYEHFGFVILEKRSETN